MSWGFVAVAGATVVSGALAADAQGDAADTQAAASDRSVAERRRQFDLMQEMLAPYAEGGEEALEAQRALLGLAGPGAQADAIAQLEQSPAFTSMVQQGEEAILQNASATGGLRGGNVQRALAQFRPQILADTIQRQYANLGGLTSLGQSSAAMTGNAGIQTAAGIGGDLQAAGAAQAAGRLGQAQTYGNTIGNLAGLFATYQNRPQTTNTTAGGSF